MLVLFLDCVDFEGKVVLVEIELVAVGCLLMSFHCLPCWIFNVSALKVDVLQGLDDVVGISPASRSVVEALVGEEVLIGGGEGGAAGVVQAVGVDLNFGGICGVISEAIKGCIEIVLHLFPLPLALVVFEKVRIAFAVVEEA